MWFFGSFLYGNNPPAPLIQSAAANIDFINLSPASYDPAFGAGPDASVKAKIINLIASVRTIMRSTFNAQTHNHPNITSYYCAFCNTRN
ncbi:YOS1 subunit of the Yip1p-Yif1p Complex required for transport between the ER and the Gol [Fusarium subglutinans]|uniref:YOS1 subunit of the Yip1p-Yif1p Complex required for transport between the ER and the Gol n=1 Tax=Gibberella subglutinans TaxID=42677 RepID=A0A8H5P9Q6_GIBSU|nr:YOS1 subunit of the Yip1p-Yif1p Complex required for transport between the ER and the Gol [Fusarium subglutinans]KAF5592618.1 YOS1 subunit of the Yip1p-Yif1p Complex required for transport between the ER and the Gol [Fusarium subglutinans]